MLNLKKTSYIFRESNFFSIITKNQHLKILFWRLGAHSLLRRHRAWVPVLRPLAGALRSLLQDPEQPGLQLHISRSCKRQEGHPGGQLGGVSVLW